MTSERRPIAHSDRFGPIIAQALRASAPSSRAAEQSAPSGPAATPARRPSPRSRHPRGRSRRRHGQGRGAPARRCAGRRSRCAGRPPRPRAGDRRGSAPRPGTEKPALDAERQPPGHCGAEPHRRGRVGEADAHAERAGHRIGARRDFAHPAGACGPPGRWSARRRSRGLAGAWSFSVGGDVEHRVAAFVARHLHDHAAGLHHLAGFGATGGDAAVHVADEFGVAETRSLRGRPAPRPHRRRTARYCARLHRLVVAYAGGPAVAQQLGLPPVVVARPRSAGRGRRRAGRGRRAGRSPHSPG